MDESSHNNDNSNSDSNSQTDYTHDDPEKGHFLPKALNLAQNAKANIKQNAKAIYNDALHPEVSRFQSWSADNLKHLLVKNNVQVRGARVASHESLVKICDEIFGPDSALPEEPASYTFQEMTDMNDAAHTIQKTFIRHKAKPRRQRHDRRSRQSYQNFEGIVNPDLLPSDDEEGGSICEEEKKIEIFRHDPKVISEDEYDDEIEREWRKPSWKFAKRYEAMMRPHRSGKEMMKYDWKNVTLGRHCVAGGCGEQLDLWDEGKTSEFGQFGIGITSYFKFLKWCSWIMLIISIINLPITIMNTFGASVQYESRTIAVTTFGNLGAADEVTEVHIPGCNENEFQQVTCAINKGVLALYYSILDFLGTIVVILGWLWLTHFEKKEAINLRRSTVTASDFTLYVLKVPADTTEKEIAAHFAKVTGEAVAAVHLAYAHANEINRYFKRGELMKQRFDLTQRIRYQKTMQKKYGKEGFDLVKLNKLLKKHKKITKTIRAGDAERIAEGHKIPKAIKAFVTFETEQGLVNAVSAYQLRWFRTICCFYPKRLRFKGMKLKVTQAPEPSTIIWENLEVSKRSHNLRKALTTTIATLAILLSVVFTFLARDFQNKALESASKDCPDGFYDLSQEDQITVIQNDSELSHCYCSQLAMAEKGKELLCRDYLQGIARSNAMSYGAGFMVVFMNSFFTWLMGKAGSFEKHQSIDGMEESIMARVFFLKFVNTGCLVLLYNQKWLQNLVNIRFNDEPDFGVKWYETGGMSMIIVMVMSIFSPHVSGIMQYVMHRHKIRKLEKKLTDKGETDDNVKIWYTQDDLNKQYLGPEFRLTYRYTQILVNFYICWMYSVSMPLMPIFGAISFYVYYWVDKFLFCNIYHIPPMYGHNIAKTSTKLIGGSIIVHLVMSIWMMGNKKIFVNPPLLTVEENAPITHRSLILDLSQTHLVPLVVLLIAFVALNVFSHAFSRWSAQMIRCFNCIMCRRGEAVSKLMKMMNTIQINYSRARDRGVIKGIASYNILQHPKYQEAFAISDEFAQEHSHLNSIRGLDTKEGSLSTKCRPSQAELIAKNV